MGKDSVKVSIQTTNGSVNVHDASGGGDLLVSGDLHGGIFVPQDSPVWLSPYSAEALLGLEYYKNTNIGKLIDEDFEQAMGSWKGLL